MDALYERMLHNLREMFVHNRFEDPNIFGRRDIEKWLRTQWEAPRPDRSMSGFGRFGEIIASHAPHPLTAEYLAQYTKPVPRRGNWAKWTEAAGPLQGLVFNVVSAGARLYRTSSGPVFTIDGAGYVARPTGIKPLDEDGFLDVVLTAWDSGIPGTSDPREFICDAMFAAIAEVRQDVQEEFDKAVEESAARAHEE